jgi:hypothetical protein
MNVSGSRLHVSPPQGIGLADCDFYHSMLIPGVGEIIGLWDLRQTVDDYLGRIDFAGKRVLEIGPASGFLTIEMERRGADVVAVELPEGVGWDFVPSPSRSLPRSGRSRSQACRASRTASGSIMRQTNRRRR